MADDDDRRNGGRSSNNGGPTSAFERLRTLTGGSPAGKRLIDELEAYVGARAERALGSLGERVGSTTRELTDVAQGRSEGGGMLSRVAEQFTGGAGPGKAVASAGVRQVGEKVKQAFGKGRGSGSGGKPTVVIEHIDIGVPVRTAYDAWTRFTEFSRWSKGVQSVDQPEPTKTEWRAKIAFSTRGWTSNIQEQVPDDHITWKSQGPKGVVNGAVSFHRLSKNLTRVLMVLEYYPGGLFEKTGNLWRAQGRRARLDLKLFRRYVMTQELPEDGWRGEIRDGEVVSENDEAPDRDEDEDEEEDEDENEDDGDDYDEEDEDYDEDEDEDEPDGEDEEEEDYDEDEDDYGDDDEEDEEDEDDAGRSSRRRRSA